MWNWGRHATQNPQILHPREASETEIKPSLNSTRKTSCFIHSQLSLCLFLLYSVTMLPHHDGV